jgi:hypothetical protein
MPLPIAVRAPPIIGEAARNPAIAGAANGMAIEATIPIIAFAPLDIR